MKQIRLGVVMDPIENFNYKKDSTLSMLWEAKKRGWRIDYIADDALFLENNKAYANIAQLDVFQNKEKWFEYGEIETTPLASYDLILMRKDPPFNMNYITITYMLELAEREGVKVYNRPQSLRDCNEKIFALNFPQCMTPTLVSKCAAAIKEFTIRHEKVILKPLDGMGGQSIFKLEKNDSNLNVIIETLSDLGQRFVMAQKFIEDVVQGDKRIIIINGEPVPYGLVRIPRKGEHRANLAAGGKGVVELLNEREEWICQQIKPALLSRGLSFVGIDVIGGYLTEVNVTSPTGLQEIGRGSPCTIEKMWLDYIEQDLSSAKK